MIEPWQNLGFTSPHRFVELAQAAEGVGMSGVTLPEHLVTPSVMTTPNPYVPGGGSGYTPETPFVDPFVAFAAMASVTTRLRFLANVYVLPLRNLFVTAKLVSSAAVMSNDRVVLGVGIGWLREEFEAVGASFGDRGTRTDEMLALLPALLRGDEVEGAGPTINFSPLRIAPPAREPVPIVVGGISDAALNRAARHDGWIGINFAEDTLMPILSRLREVRERCGDAARPFKIIVSRPPDFDHAMARRYEEAGVTAIVNRPTVFAVGADAPIDAHTDAMQEFVQTLLD